MTLFVARLFLFIALIGTSKFAITQEIDFDDLRRSGPPLRTTSVLSGANTNGLKYLNQFSEIDTGRIEERAAQSSSSSSSSSPSSSTSSSSKSQPKSGGGSSTFVCEYTCINPKFLTASDRTRLSIRLSASDKDAAFDATVKHAKNTCYEDTKRVHESGSVRCQRQ